MTIGEKIKQARIAKGMTQEELGKILGTSKSAVSKWEKGTVSNMKRSMIAQPAATLDMSPHELIVSDESIIPAKISDVKKNFILTVLDLPDDKIKTISELLKQFK